MQTSKYAVQAAVAVLCLAGAVAALRIGELARVAAHELPGVAFQVESTLAGVQMDARSAAASTGTAAAGIRAATDQLQAELPPIARQVNLDLQETHRLILESALTASEARQASADERAALPIMTAKANVSLDTLNIELQALHATTLDLDHLIDDPANVKTLESLSTGSAALAQTAQDGELWVHGLLHPSWPHRVYHVGLDVAHALLDPF